MNLSKIIQTSPMTLGNMILPFKLAQLCICRRRIVTREPIDSSQFKWLRHSPANSRTLGEHLRKKRIDLFLSMTQLTKLLGVGGRNSVATEKSSRPTVRGPVGAERNCDSPKKQ